MTVMTVKEMERQILEALDVWHPHTVAHDEQQADQNDKCLLCGVERHRHQTGRPNLSDPGVFFGMFEEWLDSVSLVKVEFERQNGPLTYSELRWTARWFVPSYQNEEHGSTIAEAGTKAWYAILRELRLLKEKVHA